MNKSIYNYFEANKKYFDLINIELELSIRDNFVNIPRVFLEMCLQEIFKNASQKKQRITGELKLIIYTEEVNDTTLEFKVYQNASFDETHKRGGFHKTIKPIFSAFGLQESFVIVSKEEFTFKINFNI